ncbi:FGGY-family carbohydrate kinase [Alkalibacter saccharofermentans]|uniref:Sugar (Pentulose or hexulose) kinase n=1 Tax=Alkalibacter saccharofermentans DSM 14828 TaxID=1120975 RepID=A0A1M4UWF0_9FIRM|nr:FGGY-family carbohydrate kinase [Alkalibacter saccharofermentans]SHE61076.1 Sugar (pentulose or hexulose) kinase [Alkalibacter saccharofermentans DSM 14828]
MNQKYIIAIDGGTQSTKVAIFDTKGTEICSHTVKLRPMELYGEGFAEHPDDDLWDSLKEACTNTMKKFNGDHKSIIGVGLGSIRCCRALVKEDGNLASPVQSWMDLRLSRPYEHTDDSVRYVTTTTGYLTHRLTGETKDTRSNYVGPWPIDPATLDWYEDKDKFEAYTTPREMLFDLVDPSSVLGYVTSEAAAVTCIPAGIPVASTSNDKAVEALGAGLEDDGTLLVSLGTYITSMMMGKEDKADTMNYWCNPGATPNEYLYESSGIRRGMATVTWIKDLLGSDIVKEAESREISTENYLNILASEIPAGSDGLYTVLHWLARPTQLHERGMIIGFNGNHNGIHMFRSVLEGIAMTMKNHAQAMCDEVGIDLKRMIVSGGGSNGELFMQIFADVFGVPAKRNVVNGSASLGAAICAALALDVYKSREEAVKNMVVKRDEFMPNSENVKLYKEINEKVYSKINLYTDELLKESHEILSKRQL